MALCCASHLTEGETAAQEGQATQWVSDQTSSSCEQGALEVSPRWPHSSLTLPSPLCAAFSPVSSRHNFHSSLILLVQPCVPGQPRKTQPHPPQTPHLDNPCYAGSLSCLRVAHILPHAIPSLPPLLLPGHKCWLNLQAVPLFPLKSCYLKQI